MIFEEHGFQFVDDFIWDKGEVQTQRHKNGNRPYPLYQYPVNCYEHIFIFYKHRLDETLYPCPVCGCSKNQWECILWSRYQILGMQEFRLLSSDQLAIVANVFLPVRS